MTQKVAEASKYVGNVVLWRVLTTQCRTAAAAVTTASAVPQAVAPVAGGLTLESLAKQVHSLSFSLAVS